MRVPITKFRQQLFRLVERAMEGERLEFIHKGVVFQVVPERRPSKLAKLTGQPVVAPGGDLARASRDLLREMEAEWEKDWSEL